MPARRIPDELKLNHSMQVYFTKAERAWVERHITEHGIRSGGAWARLILLRELATQAQVSGEMEDSGSLEPSHADQ